MVLGYSSSPRKLAVKTSVARYIVQQFRKMYRVSSTDKNFAFIAGKVLIPENISHLIPIILHTRISHHTKDILSLSSFLQSRYEK